MPEMPTEKTGSRENSASRISNRSITAEPGDIELYLQAVKINEFLHLANAELNFTYAFRARIDRLDELNKGILKEIEEEISQQQRSFSKRVS